MRYKKIKKYLYIHLCIVFILFLLAYFEVLIGMYFIIISLSYCAPVIAFSVFKVLQKEGYLKEDFRKEFVEILVVSYLFLLFFGLSSLAGLYANNINTNLDFKSYEFEVSTQPEENVVFNDLRFFYDFGLREGSISFQITEVDNSIQTERISIDFPSELGISDYKLHLNTLELKENEKYEAGKGQKIQSNKNYIVFDNFKISLEDVYFNITLEGSRYFEPNGVFRFYFNSKRTYNSESDITLLFKLGKYECKNICFGRMFNAEPEINNDIIKIRYPDDYYDNISDDTSKLLQQVVTLNTYYSPKEKSKNNYEALRIALVIASLALLGESIRRIILIIRY